MSQLTHEVAQNLQGAWIMGGMTGAFLLFFIGVTLWAWSPGQKKSLEAAGRIPFEEGGEG